MWQLSYQHALKNSLPKLVDFCIVILVMKMEGKNQHFQHIMLCYFKKNKSATEMQKRFVQFMEKVLWLIECVRSGLWSFMLEISCWIFEDNPCYTTRGTVGILKISKSVVKHHLYQLGYVNHFNVWVPNKLRKASWSYFHMWLST